MPDHKKREKKDTEPGQDNAAQQHDAREAQPVEGEVQLFPAEDVEALSADLEEQRKKCAEYFDGWQRERADFANYRRRVERDQQQTYQSLQGSIIKKFLPVLDDMGRALKARPESGDVASWAGG